MHHQRLTTGCRGPSAARPAAVDFARQRGARALDGYPMITQPGQEVTLGELHVGRFNGSTGTGSGTADGLNIAL
jgi:hypothetical protein